VELEYEAGKLKLLVQKVISQQRCRRDAMVQMVEALCEKRGTNVSRVLPSADAPLLKQLAQLELVIDALQGITPTHPITKLSQDIKAAVAALQAKELAVFANDYLLTVQERVHLTTVQQEMLLLLKLAKVQELAAKHGVLVPSRSFEGPKEKTPRPPPQPSHNPHSRGHHHAGGHLANGNGRDFLAANHPVAGPQAAFCQPPVLTDPWGRPIVAAAPKQTRQQQQAEAEKRRRRQLELQVTN
jgi:hypothetical protein